MIFLNGVAMDQSCQNFARYVMVFNFDSLLNHLQDFYRQSFVDSILYGYHSIIVSWDKLLASETLCGRKKPNMRRELSFTHNQTCFFSKLLSAFLPSECQSKFSDSQIVTRMSNFVLRSLQRKLDWLKMPKNLGAYDSSRDSNSIISNYQLDVFH